jgi:hypothetical protein
MARGAQGRGDLDRLAAVSADDRDQTSGARVAVGTRFIRPREQRFHKTDWANHRPHPEEVTRSLLRVTVSKDEDHCALIDSKLGNTAPSSSQVSASPAPDDGRAAVILYRRHNNRFHDRSGRS